MSAYPSGMADSATSRPPNAVVQAVAFGEALPALMKEPRSLMRWGVALVAHHKAIEPEQETSGALGKPGVTVPAEREGFTFLGRSAFLGFLSWIPRDAWVDEHGTTRLSARRAVAEGIEETMSSFYLSTLFDDGSAITTWSVSPAPVPSSRRWQCRGGTENFSATYAAHLDAIAEHATDTRVRPLRIESLEEFVAATKYIDVYVIPDESAASILVTRAVVWGAMLAAFVGAVSVLARLVR